MDYSLYDGIGSFLPRKILMNLGIKPPRIIVVRQTIIKVVLLMTET